MQKEIRIDIGTKEVIRNTERKDYKLLGGRMLVTKIACEEIDPKCTPLGGKNKLIFCTGVLAGSSVPCCNILCVGSKSPRTGILTTSILNGIPAMLLANHGIKTLVIRGLPKGSSWMVIRIDESSQIHFESAEPYKNKGSYSVMRMLEERYPYGFGAIVLGLAGELGYMTAEISVNGYEANVPDHTTNSNGIGNVMASKKIKAIIIERPRALRPPKPAHRNRFRKDRLKLSAILKENAENLFNEKMEFLEAPPIPEKLKNKYMYIPPNDDKETYVFNRGMSFRNFYDNIFYNCGNKRLPCQAGCEIECSNCFKDGKGEIVTYNLKYETVLLCNTLLGLKSLTAIARIDRWCDDMGLSPFRVIKALGLIIKKEIYFRGNQKIIFKMLDNAREGLFGFSSLIDDCVRTREEDLNGGERAIIKDKTLSDEKLKELQLLLIIGESYMCSMGFMNALSDVNLLFELTSSLHDRAFSIEAALELSAQTVMSERAFNKSAGAKEEKEEAPEFFKKDLINAISTSKDISRTAMEKYIEKI